MPIHNAVIDPSARLLARLYQRPRLMTAAAAATGWGIKYEARARAALRPTVPRGDSPVVRWHEGGDGPALLLLNGFTGSGLAWPVSWVRRLEARYRVIRIDNRGTGWSRDAPAPFTIADMADDARDVLVACGIDRAVVFGLSMGGIIAQEFALRHPDRAERIVLAATIPPAPAMVATPYGLSIAATLLRGPGRDISAPSVDQTDAAAQAWLRFAAPGFVAVEQLRREMGQQALQRVTTRRGILMQARAINSWSGPGRLRRITVPTTIVHGEADRIVPLENPRRIARLIPGAELVTLPGVGHLVPWEAEDALIGILDADQPRGSD